jgi:hypothetical protein
MWIYMIDPFDRCTSDNIRLFRNYTGICEHPGAQSRTLISHWNTICKMYSQPFPGYPLHLDPRIPTLRGKLQPMSFKIDSFFNDLRTFSNAIDIARLRRRVNSESTDLVYRYKCIHCVCFIPTYSILDVLHALWSRKITRTRSVEFAQTTDLLLD